MEGISSSLLTDQLIAGHSCQAGWSNHCGTIKRSGVPTKSATSVPAKQDEIQSIEGNSLAYNWACVFCFIPSIYPHKKISLSYLRKYSSISVYVNYIFLSVYQETFGCRALQALWVKRSALKPMWVTTTRRGLLGLQAFYTLTGDFVVWILCIRRGLLGMHFMNLKGTSWYEFYEITGT